MKQINSTHRQYHMQQKSLGSLTFAACVMAAIMLTTCFAKTADAYENSKINWMDYNEKSFEEARTQDKPIFMLVTAVWCFWCRAYEEKTLESEEVSDYLNKNYINILVDFDKRKDIVTGKFPPTGLPYTVVLSPIGEALVSKPGFISGKDLIYSLGKTLEYIKTEYRPTPDSTGDKSKSVSIQNTLSQKDIESAIELFKLILKDNFDTEYGGFGFREKKANGATLMFVLDMYAKTKQKIWLDMVIKSLEFAGGLNKPDGLEKADAKALVALHTDRENKDWVQRVSRLQRDHRLYGLLDPVEGGFFRYALQRNWSLPHFEKMLQENAEMIIVCLRAFEITGDARFKKLAVDSLNYVMNNLYDSQGYFYGSQAADGIYYHLDAGGRKQIKGPAVDRTGYVVSNAMMLIALIDANRILADSKYKLIAEKVINFHLKSMFSGDGVYSYYDYKTGKGQLDGQLLENAWMAQALLYAYGNLKDKKHLRTGLQIVNYILSDLSASDGGGFIARRSASEKFYRSGETVSEERPYLANGVAALALVTAHEITGEKRYLKGAENTIAEFMKRYPDASQPWLQMAAMKLITTTNK